jgi:DNA-binding NarL/FixJ family response regulator
MYRDGLAEALGRERTIEVVATASDWPSCIEAVRATKPDAIVLDLALPDRLDRVVELLEVVPGVHVIGLAVATVEDVLACAEAGMSGYVTCDDSLDELARRIESVCRGEMPCTPAVAARLLGRVADLARHARPMATAAGLTRRERQVVSLIEVGLSNKEIACRLQIGLPTVKNHVHNILEKVGAQRRGELGPRLREIPSIQGSGSLPRGVQNDA